jgi:nucleotide exchange factor SIL1
METGKKEAKLLEAEPASGPAASEPTTASLDPDALKLALKNIKSDFSPAEETAAAADPAQQTEKRRTLEELKRDFQALEANIKSEYDIMKGLFESFVSSETDEERSSVLENLEFYVHQYDNAVDFVGLNGIGMKER